MKIYQGMRTENGCSVVVEEDGEFTGLPPRYDLHNHSSDGFEWGYGEGGPAQLALALAADILSDDKKAQQVYERLQFKVIGGLPHEGWILTEKRLREAIDGIQQEQDRATGRY